MNLDAFAETLAYQTHFPGSIRYLNTVFICTVIFFILYETYITGNLNQHFVSWLEVDGSEFLPKATEFFINF